MNKKLFSLLSGSSPHEGRVQHDEPEAGAVRAHLLGLPRPLRTHPGETHTTEQIRETVELFWGVQVRVKKGPHLLSHKDSDKINFSQLRRNRTGTTTRVHISFQFTLGMIPVIAFFLTLLSPMFIVSWLPGLKSASAKRRLTQLEQSLRKKKRKQKRLAKKCVHVW